MRLDKYLANANCGTRSEVKKMIRSGMVSLHTELIKNPNHILSADEINMVYLNGQKIDAKSHLYYIIHKPDKYITALEDDHLPVIAACIPTDLLNKGIFPVGRLDYHTTGLLLLTTDGQLTHQLLNPNRHIPKKYLVNYSGILLTQKEVSLFAAGLELKESGKPNTILRPADLQINSDFEALLTITEGKTHQVRRMFAAINRPICKLHRVSFGNITLNGLSEGNIRELDEEEVHQLQQLVNFEKHAAP